MSETTSSTEPATAPVATAPTPPPVVEPAHRSRLAAVAAWVGIVAGVVFIVAVVFFSGFILGAHAGGHHGGGWHHGGEDRGAGMFHHGPPSMFQMGPRGGSGPPPFGPGGQSPQPPQSPGSPGTPAAPRP